MLWNVVWELECLRAATPHYCRNNVAPATRMCQVARMLLVMENIVMWDVCVWIADGMIVLALGPPISVDDSLWKTILPRGVFAVSSVQMEEPWMITPRLFHPSEGAVLDTQRPPSSIVCKGRPWSRWNEFAVWPCLGRCKKNTAKLKLKMQIILLHFKKQMGDPACPSSERFFFQRLFMPGRVASLPYFFAILPLTVYSHLFVYTRVYGCTLGFTSYPTIG